MRSTASSRSCPDLTTMALEWIGLLGGLALLIVLTMRGVDLLIAAPVCALLVALKQSAPIVALLAGGLDSLPHNG